MSDYTAHPTKVRVTQDEYDQGCPWRLDGWNPATGEYTKDVWSFETWAQAVNAVRAFVEYTANRGVQWPWPLATSREVTLGHVIDTARALMPQAEADNPEYVRALVELLTDISGLPHDSGRDLVRLALHLPMEGTP